jgi:hypothetical protein
MRAWHVVMANGADQTVIAQRCRLNADTIFFLNDDPDNPDEELVVVRAFGPGVWADLELVTMPDLTSPDASQRST